MSLPTLFAGKSAPGLSAALDLRFALDKSLTAYRGPTPSFSRASTGSYFDGSGVLRYAALNIFPYSEDANLNFLKDSSTVSSNVTTSPDGKLTADKLVEGSGVTSATLYRIGSAGKILSIYAKKSERDFLFLGIDGIGGCYFNLNSGAVGSAQAGSNGQIESVGNGWYRCSLKTNSAGGIPFAACSPTDSGSGIRPSYTGNGSSGIFLWGAMFENSEYLSPYAATNGSSNAGPRFNHTYNGTSWVSRGLLVEEQRTNLLTYSNTFSNGVWGLARGTVAQDQTGLDGTANAWTATCNTTGSGFYGSITPVTGASASGPYTLSVFAKKGNNGIIGLQMADSSFANYISSYFDLNSVTASSPSITGNYSLASTKIENFGNGWYRCSLTATKGSANGITSTVYFSADSTAGNCTSGQYNYFYNAQLEFGAFATSAIVTTSAQVTRSADVCQITGSDFSGFWNGTEGAIAYEADSFSNSQDNQAVFQASDGTLNNQYQSARSQNNAYTDIGFWVKTGNVWQSLIATSSGAWNQNLPNKNAMAYKINDFAFSNSGATVLTDTSGTLPTVDRINIGASVTSAGSLNGHIARLRYYRKRLPNETLQLLSEPDPTLNLQFALNKTLTPVAGPAPSFSRASTGTYFNASGVLTSASINTPRFDHTFTGGQWVSRGLLIEEQRTNLMIYSNLQSTWYATLATLASTTETNSPDGTNNARKLTEDTTASNYHYAEIVSGSPSVSSGVTYTASCFVKGNGRTRFYISSGTSRINLATYFDLANETVTSSSAISSSITNVGNGWYRCTATQTASSTGATGFQVILVDDSGNPVYTGDGVKGVFIFGFQVEQGSFPTSLIPTTSSSVTRSADVCQITGTSFNWMWNQGEGSFAVEYSLPNVVLNDRGLVGADDGGNQNYIAMYALAGGGAPIGKNVMNVYSSNVGQAEIIGQSIVANSTVKVANAWKLNDFAGYTNAIQSTPDVSGTVPSGMTNLAIGSDNLGTSMKSGHIAKLFYYTARLTNTKLQQLST